MENDRDQRPTHKKVSIRSVRIANRIRHYAGDLKPLMASLEKIGLLQPIVIDQNYNLLAGYRRLTSARLLGWKTIDAMIVNVQDKETSVWIEIDENTTRLDFSDEQLLTASRRLERYSRKGVLWKAVNWLIG